MIMNLERIILGMKYNKISKELAVYEKIPREEWTREQKERVVELLEQEAKLDDKLLEYLVADNDTFGIYVFHQNKQVNDSALDELKRDLETV